MRILISAYACEPDKGSEPEVGLQAVLTAARRHEVCVVTRSNNIPSLTRFLASNPLRSGIELVGLDLDRAALRVKRSGGLVGLNLYYHLWQRRLQEVAMSLDAEHDFDLVHHVTFATYWSRPGVAALPKPLVWGPVGGATRPPIGLLPSMGAPGAAGDVFRVLARPLIARLGRVRQVAHRAEAVLAQNPETSRAIGRERQTVILPNGLLAARSATTGSAQPGNGSFVAVGRLIPLKGHALALRVMSHLEDRTLEIFGDGPDRRRLDKLARRLRVGDRVIFRGHTPRDEVLDAVAGAEALLHPSLHDESPLVVAEALANGTPVVCLDRGGPAVMLRHWPEVPARAVAPATVAVTARRMAGALEEVAGKRVAKDPRPASWLSGRLLEVYDQVAGSA